MSSFLNCSVQNPKCVVLLAVYNGTQWLDEQIESIFRQHGVYVRLIISVDLSTDNSYEYCVGLSERDSRVEVLPYGKRFGGAGKNFFRLASEVDTSAYDYVALADQDDVWLEDKLSRACTKLSTGIYDVYSSDVTAFWSDGTRSLIKKSYPQKLYDHFYEAAGPGCTCVFNASVFQALQHFLNKNKLQCEAVELHDWFFYAYCRNAGYNWLIDDQPSMLYRQHDRNQVGANNNVSAYLKRLKMIKDGWYRDQVVKICTIVAPEMVDQLLSRKFMVRHFKDLRRRPRDRFALFIMTLLGLF